MFLPNIHRTQAAVSVYSRHPVTPPAATEWCRLMLDDVICSVRRTRRLTMGMTQQFSRFCPWCLWHLTLTFKLVRARLQTRLLCKFGANPFSRFRDIWLTNKQTISQTKHPKTEPYLRAVKAKVHYTSWFAASSELAPNMFGASSELASVMEFGFK